MKLIMSRFRREAQFFQIIPFTAVYLLLGSSAVSQTEIKGPYSIFYKRKDA